MSKHWVRSRKEIGLTPIGESGYNHHHMHCSSRVFDIKSLSHMWAAPRWFTKRLVIWLHLRKRSIKYIVCMLSMSAMFDRR